jgi:hypothetical protein
MGGRVRLARLFGLLLGYLACVLGIRLVDRIEDQLLERVGEGAA